MGEAIAASGIRRSELFIASKCWTTTIANGREAVRKQVEKTIADLGIDAIDLYAIHWPVPVVHVEAYRELVALKRAGKIRSLGVSNYVSDCERSFLSSDRVPSTDTHVRA